MLQINNFFLVSSNSSTKLDLFLVRLIYLIAIVVFVKSFFKKAERILWIYTNVVSYQQPHSLSLSLTYKFLNLYSCLLIFSLIILSSSSKLTIKNKKYVSYVNDDDISVVNLVPQIYGRIDFSFLF